MGKKEVFTSKDAEARLFGLDEEASLLSVNFATTENLLLNEHFRDEDKEL